MFIIVEKAKAKINKIASESLPLVALPQNESASRFTLRRKSRELELIA
jgi:hypothetical protein